MVCLNGIALIYIFCPANHLLSALQVLEDSRWNIFIFSKESVADPFFTSQYSAAVHASIDDNQLQVIPVVSKGVSLEEIPSNYKWITLLQSEDANFTEKLWQLMESMFFNPLHDGGLFRCDLLDESICHFRGVGCILLLLFYFWWKILLANNVDPDQMPHYVASDQGLRCLPMMLLDISR